MNKQYYINTKPPGDEKFVSGGPKYPVHTLEEARKLMKGFEEKRRNQMNKPGFLGEPRIRKRSDKIYHAYEIPDSGDEIVATINWMNSEYTDITCEYGTSNGMEFCHLIGKVIEDKS